MLRGVAEQDQYGLAISTDSAEAAEAWREAVARICALQEPMDALYRAAAADPGFALPAAHLSNIFRLAGDMPRAEAALAAIDLARATPREQANVEVMRLLLAGRGRAAVTLMIETLQRWPTDAPLLSVLHRALVNAYPERDRREVHHRIVEDAARGYPADDWYILSERAYAAEEVGELDRAASFATAALDGNPHSAEAAHALAHVTYERADVDGRRWLAGWLDRWEHPSVFAGHLQWHVAIAALAEGDVAGALAVAAAADEPDAMPTLRLVNWGSLFWRLQLDDAPDLPWASLAGLKAPPFFSFGVCHEAMVRAATGDVEGLRGLAAEQQRLADRVPSARVAATVAEALLALIDSRAADAVRLLESVREDVVIVGGSRAQQDVFEDTLIAAYLQCGRHDDAAALLEARVARRPFSRDRAWLARCRDR
jgi:tetratricopeptide (TPR) repeat protein